MDWYSAYIHSRQNQGSKFFPFQADSFSEGGKNISDRVTFPGCVSIPLKHITS